MEDNKTKNLQGVSQEAAEKSAQGLSLAQAEKKRRALKETAAFKKRYFDYYDDVKISAREDW